MGCNDPTTPPTPTPPGDGSWTLAEAGLQGAPFLINSKNLDLEFPRAWVRMARAAVWRACGVMVMQGEGAEVGRGMVVGDDGLMVVQLLLLLRLSLLLLQLLPLLLLTVVAAVAVWEREVQLTAAPAAVLSIVWAALVATAAASLASNRSSICCSRCLARLRCRGGGGGGGG